MIPDRLESNLRQGFRESLLPKLGLVLLVSILIMAIFAPVLATHNPTRTGYLDENGNSYPPLGTSYTTEIGQDGEFVEVEVESTSDHLLGTNDIGQDVFSRLVYGARTSMLVGLLGTGLAVLIGVPFGLVSGYYGGRVDDVMMRIADTMLAFPSLVLALALIGVFGSAGFGIPDPLTRFGLIDGMPESTTLPGTVTVVVALVTWVWFARVARGEAMSVRNEEYVTAARSMGASNWTILFKHVLPNSLTPVIVLATIQVAAVILLESSLSFLGFSGTTLSWGYDISRGQGYQRTSWWISMVPGLGIVFAVIAVNLLGDWLRDALDPNIEGEGGGA